MPRRQAASPVRSMTPVTPLVVRDGVDRHLLTRGLVVVDSSAGTTAVVPDAAVVGLEADVLDRGHLLQAELRAALGRLAPAELAQARTGLLARIDASLGADKPHVPLFRRFPWSTPQDTERLWVDRVLSELYQQPEQPCVLCGTVGSVRAVSPCSHLVCAVCFDGSDYSACPVCRRRIDADDPFLRPAPPRRRRRETTTGPLRLLRLVADRDAAVRAELDRLLPRSAAPSAADLAALAVLVDHQAVEHPADLGWLPASIPARTAKATVLARLLTWPQTRAHACAVLAAQCDTATDVLRTAVVLTGGAADLTPSLERAGTIPRPVRRALLATLDGLGVETAAEDVLRHVAAWKRVAETLHPFEHAHRHPRAALLVAVVRQTRLAVLDPGLRALLERVAAEHPDVLTVDGDRLRVATFGGAVEGALREGSLGTAVRLLSSRPGELFRRLDHLLALAAAHDEPQVRLVLDAAAAAVARVSPAVLVSALGELTRRDGVGPRRVFFPAGRIAALHTAADTRPPLPGAVVAAVRALVEGELLRRASRLAPYEVAVLDDALRSVGVPFTARTTSRSFVEVPRGSFLPLPDADVLRLFLHWTEPAGTRVDLDLSVALYDAHFSLVGLCDYTRMRFGGSAVVHSGDLTSAPAPLGASEFVDLDLAELARMRITYAVPVVFSYNDVPFDQMDDAFAGVMARSAEAAWENAHFDARTVQQRLDLGGEARITVPMVVDLATGRLCWLDMNLGIAGYGHNLYSYAGQVAHLARSLVEHYAGGRRTTMWQLVVWHAAARATTVVLRRAGHLEAYERRSGETPAELAHRLDVGEDADRVLPGPGFGENVPVLAALQVGDLELAAGSTGYALFPGSLGGTHVHLVTGLDLLSQLTPDPGA